MTPFTSFLAGLVAIVLIYRFWKFFFTTSALPQIPIVGFDEKQWFPWVNARIRSQKDYHGILKEGHEKYASKGKASIVPDFSGDWILLPNSSSQWIVDQPDHVLDTQERLNDTLAAKWTLPDPKVADHPYHVHVIKVELTRRLAGLNEVLMEEVAAAFSQTWGNDTENWKELVLYENMMKIIARASNRLFVGERLCRNEDYLYRCRRFAEVVPLSSLILRLIPPILKPLLGPILTIPNKYQFRKIRQHLDGEIEARLHGLQHGYSGTEAGSLKTEPNDFLQWYIRYAEKALEPEERDPRILAARIASMNFAAIHTSTFSSVNTIYDLLSSPSRDATLTTLEKECETALAADGGRWTKQTLLKMGHMDSTVRESLRYSSFATSSLQKKVLAKEGIVTPDGTHVKYGNVVGVSALVIHRNSDIYPDPDSYVPFRFVKQEQPQQKVSEDRSRTPSEMEKASKTHRSNTQTIVDTSTSFLTFGHGRHACPGRFLAANEIKLLLAYIVRHYDVQPLKERPEPLRIGSISAPNMVTKIQVRRKKGTV